MVGGPGQDPSRPRSEAFGVALGPSRPEAAGDWVTSAQNDVGAHAETAHAAITPTSRRGWHALAVPHGHLGGLTPPFPERTHVDVNDRRAPVPRQAGDRGVAPQEAGLGILKRDRNFKATQS